MNCAVYQTGSDSVSYFVHDAILKRAGTACSVIGDRKVSGLKSGWSFLWTNDDTQPVYDGGNQIGWDKTVSQLTQAQGIEIAKETRQGLATAVEIQNHIAGLTYAQVETYVDNNVTDLASAKTFLKLLAKALLATIKLAN